MNSLKWRLAGSVGWFPGTALDCRGKGMRSDHRISYWRKGQHPQNFGDMLSELLFSALCRGSWMDPKAGRARSDYDVIHLLGSVISDWHIERDLEHVGLPCKRP